MNVMTWQFQIVFCLYLMISQKVSVFLRKLILIISNTNFKQILWNFTEKLNLFKFSFIFFKYYVKILAHKAVYRNIVGNVRMPGGPQTAKPAKTNSLFGFMFEYVNVCLFLFRFAQDPAYVAWCFIWCMFWLYFRFLTKFEIINLE